MIIFESLLTTFEATSIFEAPGAVAKPSHHNQVEDVQIPDKYKLERTIEQPTLRSNPEYRDQTSYRNQQRWPSSDQVQIRSGADAEQDVQACTEAGSR